MHPRLIIVGAGDHGRVMADVARALGRNNIAFIQPAGSGLAVRSGEVDGAPILGSLDEPAVGLEGEVEFVVALGGNEARAAAFARCLGLGWQPTQLVHPTAIRLGAAQLGAGVQVCAGAIIGLAARIGDDVIVNTAASVDHDARIADHAFIGPGARLAGRVTVGLLAHVGIGATIREGCTIGDRAIVAAGAVVVDDVRPMQRVAGVPARLMGQTSAPEVGR